MQKLTSLTVRLRWVGTGIEKLRPEDERQKVVERSTQDGEKQLLDRIQPVSEQDLKAAPVEADELRPYLAEDRYIKPHDPKVVEQSLIWKGDAQTPSDVVRALSRGVFTFMQGGSLIVETPVGSGDSAMQAGKMLRIRDPVRIGGPVGRHSDEDRAGHAVGERFLGGTHVERGVCGALDDRRCDDGRSGQRTRPVETRG